jgi:hypothetical protein
MRGVTADWHELVYGTSHLGHSPGRGARRAHPEPPAAVRQDPPTYSGRCRAAMTDPRTAERLWELSEKAVGVTFRP